MLELQRLVGNRAVGLYVQRHFDGELLNKTYLEVHAQLKEAYDGAPPAWKVGQLMNDRTKGYSSLAQVAQAFGLKLKGSSTTPTVDAPKETPTVVPTPTKRPAVGVTGPKPTGTVVPASTPVVSADPPKEGTLQVLDPLNLQEPETGHKVFAAPPEYIRVRMGSAEYRVVAGQDFLNTGTSARYKADPTGIKGSKAKLQRPTLDKTGGEAPADIRVIGDGHHRFIWGAFAGLPVAAETKSFTMFPNPWSNLTYKEAPGVEPAPIKPAPRGPTRAVKTPAKAEKTEETEKTPATEKAMPSMARIENPEWGLIEPLLAGYGITTDDDKRKIKATLDENLKDTENTKPIRGITDLIGRALGGDRQTAAAKYVREQNTAAAPDVTGQTISVGRGDTRTPHQIRETGGLFGWDQGVVSIAHARQIAKTVLAMPVAQQKTWITSWKWPTPSPAEGNPWVATGRGKQGGQKGGSGEIFADIPLVPQKATSGFQMIILTDTGDINSASVIGVQLHLPGGGDTEELIMLTGIPWKYITGWEGKIEGQNGEQPKRWDKNTAADLTKPKPK